MQAEDDAHRRQIAADYAGAQAYLEGCTVDDTWDRCAGDPCAASGRAADFRWAVVAIAINTDSLQRKHRALDHIVSPNYRRSKDHPSASFAVVDEKTITFLRRYIEMVHVLPAVDLPACASQIIGNLIYASTGVIKR